MNKQLFADCKSAGFAFDGSNPSSSTKPETIENIVVSGIFYAFLRFSQKRKNANFTK